jgi:hypothetical protein
MSNNNISNLGMVGDLQDVRAHRILEEQRRQAFMVLQQQEIDKTISEISAQGMRHQPQQKWPRQGSGVNPIDIECRNIIALQEELKRQENRKRVEEFLQAKMQEQALLSHLQKQGNRAQSTDEQIISHFAELNNIAARQEALGRSAGNPGSSFNNNSNLLNRLRNESGNGSNQEHLINSLLSQRNGGGMQGSTLGQSQQINRQQFSQHSLSDSEILMRLTQAAAVNNNLPNGNFQALRNQLGGRHMSPPPQSNLDRCNSILEQTLSNAHTSRVAGNSAGFSSPSALPPTSSSSSTQIDLQHSKPDTPVIRYFNDGAEVNQNGDEISHLSGKKRKGPATGSNSMKNIRNYNRRRSPNMKLMQELRQKNDEVKAEQVATEQVANFLKKRNQKYQLPSQVLQSKNDGSHKDNDNGSDNNNGPHSNRRGSMFKPNPISDQDKEASKPSRTDADKEEDKLDAANVLLGFMKRG